MKIDFDQQLKTFGDTPMVARMAADGDPTPVTLKAIALNALTAETPASERPLGGEEKIKRYRLAQRVFENAGDFSVEDLALIKQLVGVSFGVAIVGAVYAVLDPPS